MGEASMLCRHCQRSIDDDSAYCRFCGSAQQAAPGPLGHKRLTRSPANGKVAGVCAGLAEYLDVDVTFVRVVWVVLSIVPGMVVGGLIAYLAAWLVMPERVGQAPVPVSGRKRLERSATDRKIAGVCGGLAEYFDVDSTPVRVLWIILTLLPGAIVLGVVAYLAAWLVMPNAAPVHDARSFQSISA
jgi:phage shock protein PspC (stress-responsive transcriptional regulator)